MSSVTGPISSLPGSRHSLPPGTMCDEHPDLPAVERVQGETDSFGCEMNDLCQECLTKHGTSEPYDGRCDLCKRDASDLRPIRDPDEGMCGPVYHACSPCRIRRRAALQAELADRDDDWDEVPW